MSHTPGPWHVDDGFKKPCFRITLSNGDSYKGGGFEIRDSAGTVSVARGVWDEKNRDTVIANVCLIKTAPELLDALKVATHALRKLNVDVSAFDVIIDKATND